MDGTLHNVVTGHLDLDIRGSGLHSEEAEETRDHFTPDTTLPDT